MTATLPAPSADRTSRQRTLLRVDAGLCALLGLPAAVAPEAVADLLGPDVSATPVRLVGVALVLYALDLVVVTRLADRWQRPATLAAGIGSVAWALATVGLVVAGAFSAAGAVVALVVGAVVGELGVLQLRATSSSASPAPTRAR